MLAISHNSSTEFSGYAVHLAEHEVRLRVLRSGESLYARYDGQGFELWPRFITPDAQVDPITITSETPLEAWSARERLGVFAELKLVADAEGMELLADAETLAIYRDGQWSGVDGVDLGAVTICLPGYRFAPVMFVPLPRERASALAEL